MAGEVGIHRRQIADGQISPNKLASSLKDCGYFYHPCNVNYPVLGPAPYAFPTAGDGNNGRLCTPYGDVLYRMAGSQTLLGPVMDSAEAKLDIGLDEANAEGVEYVINSFLAAGARLNHVVGTSAPFMVRAKLTIEDVSGAAECALGVRKVEAFQAAIDDYDELACLNVQAGTINVETILNNGTTDTVDTGLTWGDGEEKELKVVVGIGYPGVSNAGKVRFYVDGVRVGPDTFVFDSAEVLTGFIHFLQGGDACRLFASEIEAGFLRDFDDQYLF